MFHFSILLLAAAISNQFLQAIKGFLRLYRIKVTYKSRLKTDYGALLGGFNPKMDLNQARLILNVKEHALPEQVKQRHRSLIRNNHPDNGGSTFIATKVNQAKQLILNS